jgi:DNA-binding NtrC family response regulator
MKQPIRISLPVLLVDDEPDFLQSASVTLRMSGFEAVTCQDSAMVLSMLSRQTIGIVVLDILMPACKGTQLLPEIIKTFPEIPVIMLTALNSVETAVECMRLGAFDYLVKPVEKNRLITSVRRAMDLVEIRNENRRLKDSLFTDQLKQPGLFEGFITGDAKMGMIFHYIEAIAPTSMPVLITGETGVGKELAARIIHNASGRAGEFVSVNIAGLDENMVSDTLFGHEKGAFTGAYARRDGLVAKAVDGTLFLDEIGDLAREMQIKLLRLLEERTYYPVGSDSLMRSNARVVVATNKNIAAMRKEGSFRNDLFFRLQSHQIDIPPLRKRPGDIVLLADIFCTQAAGELKKPPPAIPSEIYALLSAYTFPGNVRELKNIIYDAVSMEKSDKLSSALITEYLAKDGSTLGSLTAADTTPFTSQEDLARRPRLPTIKNAEAMLIREALKRANGNQTVAARLLGMKRSAFNKRIIRGRE